MLLNFILLENSELELLSPSAMMLNSKTKLGKIVCSITVYLQFTLSPATVSHSSRQEQMGARPAPYVYVSTERSKCLEICSWPHSRTGRYDDGCENIVKKLVTSGALHFLVFQV